jgi:hypothetical protein
MKEVFRRFQEGDLPLESLRLDIYDGQEEGVWREGRLLLDLGKGEAWARWA